VSGFLECGIWLSGCLKQEESRPVLRKERTYTMEGGGQIGVTAGKLGSICNGFVTVVQNIIK
jgi:hypothetical protein